MHDYDGDRRRHNTLPVSIKGRANPNRGRTFPIEILTRDEINALLGGCSTRGAAGIRDRALIALLYRAGLRISEALALEPRDVDLANGTINIRRGKGAKQRIVGVDAGTCALLERWIEKRRQIGLGRARTLFCVISQPTAGKPLYTSQVRTKLQALARKAEITKRVHPHGLRHTMAVELLREGKDLKVIQGQLGHSNPATTDGYLRGLHPRRVIDAMRGREWDAAA